MSATRSEDVLGQKWDRCLADTSVKILGGETLDTGCYGGEGKCFMFDLFKVWPSEACSLYFFLRGKCGP